MARRPRQLLADYPFHLIVRGNNRQVVFADDADRRDYKSILQKASSECGLQVHAYALMLNHVHLVVTPQHIRAVADVMQALGRQYVRRFNRRHDRTGTLWEGRYRASIIQDDRYLFTCQRYVETTPVRIGIVTRPEDFRWTSHRHHLGLENDTLVSPHPLYWALGNTPFDREAAYRALFESAPQTSDESLTRTLSAGHPLAEQAFLDRIERLTGLAWAPRPVGRPRAGR